MTKNILNIFIKMSLTRDFPGGPVVKNPPSNAGDAGSIPGRGTKIPHATWQLRPCATTTELVRHTREKPTCHNERSCVPQLTHSAAKK